MEYYVKSGSSKIEITDDNIFTHCPKCGAEHQVCIDEMAMAIAEDGIWCEKCSLEYQEGQRSAKK